MFGKKKRMASAMPAAVDDTTMDGTVAVPTPQDTPKKKPGPVKCALLALRDWVIYYAIMIALSLAIEPFTGNLVNLILPILVNGVAGYFVGRHLMKKRPEGTVYRIPRKRVWLLALAYMAIIIPMKTAFHDLTMAAGGDYGIGPLGDFLMLVLIAPMTEELLYRGVLFPLAERRSGFWPAAIMNAMVFAAAHHPDVGNMVTASMCIVECALQSITGRTRYGIMLHMIFNCLNIPLAIIEPSLSPVAGIAAIVVAWTTHILFCVKRDAVAQRLIPGWMGCPPRADTPEEACC